MREIGEGDKAITYLELAKSIIIYLMKRLQLKVLGILREPDDRKHITNKYNQKSRASNKINTIVAA